MKFSDNAGAMIQGFFIGSSLMTIAFISMIKAYPMTVQAQSEAVKAGHAEYYLDAKNERQWRWLPVAKKEGARE